MWLYPVLFVWLLILSVILTNPFSRISIIRPTYKAKFKRGTVTSKNNNSKLRIHNNPLSKLYAYIKSGLYILETRYINSPAANGSTAKTIIAHIHDHRFKPTKLLLISGDHFNSLFVRNLGVFYYPMLDTAIPSSKTDWQNRQIVYLQTVAFALGVMAKTDKLTTTFVPLAPQSVACINFYAYPSDTLYGVLYGLASLLGLEAAKPYVYAPSALSLKTQVEAKSLLATYRLDLHRHYITYRHTVFDSKKSLVRSDIHLSGAKDITKRTCALYDNVIFWKTTELAEKLGLIDIDIVFRKRLKQRILRKFWLPDEGYFLEDLSNEAKANKYYSSDWLVVLFTGFLKPSIKREQHYFTRSIDYINKMNIACPFAIKYQHETRQARQFPVVRLTVASYGGDAIWSFWGMEYIKLLLWLHRLTKDKVYLTEADHHIKYYNEKMIENRGFPEVYDSKGRLLKTPFYQSIRMTGWVIGFEQVLSMRSAARRNKFS